ncbi:hypothetical protein EV421DRAFT_2013871 [Armillaria borealis]|uniref:Peptide N-acetyl-beta-D-glucosaminyl asparaginase amidase A N-terminal domain-containing protein n=1 Tax=Armillaria borealis TaxID=47425 RepID=A0AA39K9N3_9AGAR|nr:hypothetical protein EV421DRAFT_2013871 [Armillaria borealis]
MPPVPHQGSPTLEIQPGVSSANPNIKEGWRTHLDVIAKQRFCVGFLAESCTNPKTHLSSDRVQSHPSSKPVPALCGRMTSHWKVLLPGARRRDVHPLVAWTICLAWISPRGAWMWIYSQNEIQQGYQKAYIQIFCSGNSAEEFWYLNSTDQVGKHPFREVQVLVDVIVNEEPIAENARPSFAEQARDDEWR